MRRSLILLCLFQAVGLQAAPAPLTAPRFAEGFVLADGDVVVWAGGTTLGQQAALGHLETLLTRAASGKRIRFRDASWQADTVFRQQRPLNFGSELEFLQRIGATVIFAHYGQMESLDGAEQLPAFVAAYETRLDLFAQQTPNLVLVTPQPFTRPPHQPHLPDLTRHNEDLRAYAEAVRDLAHRRRLPCIDLSGFSGAGYTLDGIHLTPAGHGAWAREAAAQLLGERPECYVDRTGAFEDQELESLRQAIVWKNTLWQRHWRPANWAFVFGDRQHVPSSHDHRPGHPRWFPAELEGILDSIAVAEAQIESLKPQADPP